jgi:predicted TIM-barrel fold metal-dependent hydrolase
MTTSTNAVAKELGYAPFDCDNHYYEALDAFTRHVDPKLQPRCVQWCEIDGRKYHVVGGKVSRAVVNATFDPIAKAGAMHDYFRGNPDKKSPLEFLKEREPIRPEYRDPAARVARMDEFGLSSVWVFPTLGMLYEEMLKHDPFAVTTLFRGFNRWILDDWGFDHEGRVFTAPYLTLADPQWAEEEVDWMLANGARVIVMRPAAAFTALGASSPFAPKFDGVWGRINEAGIPVVIHAGDSGNSSNGYAVDGFSASFTGGGWAPSISGFKIERAAFEFIITSVFEKLFDRFPNLRMASVENGSDFLPDLVRKLRNTTKKMPGYFQNDPVDSLKQHWWINPFWEDDVNEIAEVMGTDHVLFGSDWPHIEGMPQPLDYVPELSKFDDAERKQILLDNVTFLNTPRPL